MSRKVLLTRSKEDNEYLRQILVPKGYGCLEFSLIKHVNLPFDKTILESFTDIIITSKRAASFLPKCHGKKNVWIVGSTSAEILKKKNYNIKYIANSASELKGQLPNNIHKHMLYLSGNIITVEMPEKIKKLIVYKVEYKKNLIDSEIQMLKNGLDYILLYSENCAKTLIKLIVGNDLLKYVENSVIIAISSKVARVVDGYFQKIVPCAYANQILKKLEDYDKVRKD